MFNKATHSWTTFVVAAGLALAVVGPAPARAAADVSSQLEVKKVVVEAGHESLRSAADAKPGDTLQYRATYTNKGTSAAQHLLAKLPIPKGTTLKPDSGLPAGAMASVDGQNFASMPLMRNVNGKDGKPLREPVPLADIRALRWDLGNLDPKQSKTVQLNVHVDAPLPAEPTAAAPKK
ncbi:MAG: hypothetical protein JSR26_07710 [Proteobacteria bacterium]|nr:hypothetical protein [Pseudomonadota bacterium]